MQYLRNWIPGYLKHSIKGKLFAMAGILSTLLIAIVVLSIYIGNRQTRDFQRFEKEVTEINLVNAVGEYFAEIRIAANNFRGTHNMKSFRDVKSLVGKISGLQQRLERDALNLETRKQLSQIISDSKKYGAVFSDLRVADSNQMNQVFYDQLNVINKSVSDVLKKLKLTSSNKLKEIAANRHALSKSLRLYLLIGAAIFLLLGVAITYTVSNSISSTVAYIAMAVNKIALKQYDTEIPGTHLEDEIGDIARKLAEFRDQLAEAEIEDTRRRQFARKQTRFFEQFGKCLSAFVEGDLKSRIDEEGVPEDLEGAEASLCRDFNTFAEKFEDVIATIQSSSENIKAGSTEMATVAVDLSKRTETQAATLEESAAALDQLTVSVKSAAEKSSEANDVVISNRQQALLGKEIVQRAIEAMQQIEESSQSISKIVGVIDDIAFQTNLLALNAGVEAARAGDAGHGFAVVASEVRSLAQRASDSAQGIKDLISESAAQVENGSDLVSKTGVVLQEIVNKAERVAVLVSDISSSSREQASGLQEINSGVNQLDQVSQQNAAMVEESTATSQHMSNEAQRLTQILARFRIEAQSDGLDLLDNGSIVSPEDDRPAPTQEPEPIAARADARQPLRVAASDAEIWQDF